MGCFAAVRVSTCRLIHTFRIAQQGILARASQIGRSPWRHFAARIKCEPAPGKSGAPGVHAQNPRTSPRASAVRVTDDRRAISAGGSV